MSKKKSDDLFILIHTLSKSEKRYFKCFYKSNSDKKYIKLFDIVDRQEKFDDDAILNTDSSFLPSQLSNLKAHLYNKILHSLRTYFLTSIPEIKIRELIDEVEILFNKGLYKQCAKRLKKAEKLIGDIDNLELNLVLLKWKKSMFMKDHHKKEDINKIIEKVKIINQKINNVNIFSNLQIELQTLYRKTGYIKNESEYQKIKKIVQSTLPVVNENHLSTTEKIYFYQVYVGYYLFIQDFENSKKYAVKWVNIFRSKKSLPKVALEHYITGLNYLLISLNKLQFYDDFQTVKKELRALNKLNTPIYNENIRLRLFKYTFVHEFNGMFLNGDFNKGVKLFERLASGLENFIEQLDEHSRIIFFYKSACLYFGNSEFKKSILWLNRILQTPEPDLREDIHGFARILFLICHYELGNMDIIPYAIRSTYRFLFKKQDFLDYQRLMLNFLKGLSHYNSDKNVIFQFQILKNKMLKIQSNRFERGLVYFDIVSWLESKIEQRPIMEISKEKAMARHESQQKHTSRMVDYET